MKVVLQRVLKASVTIDNRTVGAIGKGLLLLVGVHSNDTEAEARFLADKCAEIRVFPDENEKMNLSLIDIKGAALVVSQFTLLGDCRKGRRPSFIEAAQPSKGEKLYNLFIEHLKSRINDVQCGVFGAMMKVELINDGPVTLILEKEGIRSVTP